MMGSLVASSGGRVNLVLVFVVITLVVEMRMVNIHGVGIIDVVRGHSWH